MNCLIVAAGTGGRLRERGPSKPLVQVYGVGLLERVIMRARAAGVQHFLVVTGYRGDAVRAELDAISERVGISIKHVDNDEWQRGNGVSVSKARPYLTGPFVLCMCDHLVDPAILRELMALEPKPDTVTLAVDFNIAGSINAIDTGVFLCTPVIFDALESSQAQGDESISGAMNVLARQGKARVFDIQGRLWLDVDDPASLEKAEALLKSGRL